MSGMQKLPRSQARAYTVGALAQQGGRCPLCLEYITGPGNAVLDHDHSTGEVRGVLHRSCNAAEGKVAHAAGRWGSKSAAYKDVVPWLKRLVQYLETSGHGVIHPAHKTDEEKRAQRNLKARQARAAQKAKAAMKQPRSK